jgi:enamine deaminase RidA (YjgF/YER057c/UK114 family)
MMLMQSVRTPFVKEPKPGTWTNAKVFQNQFFVSGMTAHDLEGKVQGDGSMYDQTKITFQKIRNLVEAAGAKMNDIIELSIFVTNINEREEVWRARQEFFSGDFPCCTLVEVKGLATPPLKVEIKAMGFIGAGQQ